ncbi:MAG: DUF1524 domain-containing protein, partial [Bacteroidales bacterium]|nr:DUF1524 domain-containing protein [Bacteroidales bacterium]
PAKWGFLESPLTQGIENHIEFIFRLLAEKENKGQYGTYLYFEKKIQDDEASNSQQASKALKVWDEIKNAFARVNSWFCDVTPDTSTDIYHYVGYLLATGGMSVQNIFSLSENKGREEFKAELRKSVIDSIKGLNLEEINYQSSSESVKRILLLFNVLTCMKIAKGPFNRFPFDRYNAIEHNNKWSLEHINAQQSKDPIKKPEALYQWVHDTWNSIKNIDTIRKMVVDEQGNKSEQVISISKEKGDLESLCKLTKEELDSELVKNLKEKIDRLFDEGDFKHALGNMALLSKPDNSALNNSIFPVKRDHLIRLEKEGKFIPPCTRNVFLKFYSVADTQPYYWSRHDQQQYFENIVQVIEEFKKEDSNG